LLQHNLATFTQVSEKLKLVTYYEIIPEALTRRDYYPRYLMRVEALDCSLDCRQVFESILIHGRMNVENLVALFNESRDTVCHQLGILLDARFIKPCRLEDSMSIPDQMIDQERIAIEASAVPLTTSEISKLRRTLATNYEDSKVVCLNIEAQSRRVGS
jgi:hypothetical protein